jgi:TrmH family RNA methyltransferase
MRTGSPGEPPGVIRSADNRTIKFVRSLRRRSARQAERAFVVEGVRAVADALSLGVQPRFVMTREGDPSAGQMLDQRLDIGVRIVERRLFDDLAETVAPQGIMAVFDMPKLPVELNDAPLILVLDRLSDPGNVGTLLRSAAGAGVALVAVTAETVDLFNAKVVRAAMGVHFRVPVRLWDDEVRELVVSACPLRVLADARADEIYDRVDLTRGTALIIGSEAHGATAALAALASVRVRIPLARGVESLNAAVAGAVLLYEAARQRRVLDT